MGYQDGPPAPGHAPAAGATPRKPNFQTSGYGTAPRLKCPAVADSLEEAGERLFAFTRLDPSQWKSARTTNAIERLNEEFRRRIETQTVLPCAETVPMLLWILLASARSPCARSTDGRPSPSPSSPSPLTRPPDQADILMLGARRSTISTTSQTRPSIASIFSDVEDSGETLGGSKRRRDMRWCSWRSWRSPKADSDGQTHHKRLLTDAALASATRFLAQVGLRGAANRPLNLSIVSAVYDPW